MAHVLIVDDDINVLRSLTRLLENDHAVIAVGTAEEACEYVRSRLVDMVVLDYRLPGINGGQALGVIQRHDPGIPVVMISGYGTVQLAVELLGQGAVDFLGKPFSNDDFLLSIGKALCRRQSKVKGLPEILVDLRRHIRDACSSGSDPGDPCTRSMLLQLATCQSLSTPAFRWSANAIRAVVLPQRSPERLEPWRLVEEAVSVIDELQELPEDLGIAKVVAIAEAATRNHRPLDEAMLADALSTSTTVLRHLILKHARATWPQLKRAVRVRPALMPLVNTREHVSQIAFQTGYDHLEQFDRDFAQMFGQSPKAFRSWCGLALSFLRTNR